MFFNRSHNALTAIYRKIHLFPHYKLSYGYQTFLRSRLNSRGAIIVIQSRYLSPPTRVANFNKKYFLQPWLWRSFFFQNQPFLITGNFTVLVGYLRWSSGMFHIRQWKILMFFEKMIGLVQWRECSRHQSTRNVSFKYCIRETSIYCSNNSDKLCLSSNWKRTYSYER